MTSRFLQFLRARTGSLRLIPIAALALVGAASAWAVDTGFADVNPDSYAAPYIKAIKDAGITTGCGGGNYCPTQTVTRDQMAAFIIRAMEGNPPANYCGGTSPFADVPATSGFCGHIKRMLELGISTGCGGGNYCPTQIVTREQMAAFIIRALEGNPPAGYCGSTSPFADVPATSGFCGYTKRMLELGITTGCGGGNYCPTQTVTRESMAIFLARAFLGMTTAPLQTLTVQSSGASAVAIASDLPEYGGTTSYTKNVISSIKVTLDAPTIVGSGASTLAFKSWSGCDSQFGNSCVVTMNAARTVIVTYGPPATTTYKYDANGNLTDLIDPLGNLRQATYDALDRPNLIKEPSATTVGATAGQIVPAYDGQDQVTSVKDPRNLSTAYTVDGLGNLTTLASPDTGTATYTYDAAGNLKTRTDLDGRTATYTYDALNRMTQVTYTKSGLATLTATLTWDTCANGKGRLCQIVDGASTTVYGYDLAGRVTGKTVTLGGVTHSIAYRYNSAGQLDQVTTPSGQTIRYTWANGRVNAVATAFGPGADTPLLANLQYQPFGSISGGTWGNGQTMFRRYDLAGRLTGFSLGSDSRALSYDAAGRVVGLAAPNDADLSLVFGYDGLDRLTSAQRGSPVSSTLTYGYDLSGNRTSKTLANPSTSTTTYAIAANSNRLSSLSGAENKTFDYDNAGNMKTSGAVAYGYDAAGRLTSAGTSTYAYNALGQRVKKTVAGVTTWFVYDEQGHLLGEYDSAGKLIQETAWLGDMPVATLRLPQGASSGAASVFYVHADHLGTPRLVTRAADNKVMWQWESEPFGNSLPNQNPQGQGPFVYNLRFPGQYYDAETGLAYNYFRDYDANTGRYVQSDPVGLRSGVNTYGYVNGNPLANFDSLGLWTTNAHDFFINNLPGFTSQQGEWMKAGSEYTDRFAFQDAEHSYMHAMSSDVLDGAAARRKWCEFVQSKLDAFQRQRMMPSPRMQEVAYFNLGMALHAVMDSTAPSHRGFQMWRNSDFGSHGDFMASMETLDVARYFNGETVSRMKEVLSGQLPDFCSCR